MIEPIKIIVQARVNSTRLRGKVLMEMADLPMIQLLLHRLKGSSFGLGIILATGDGPENYPLRNISEKAQVDFFAGSEENVLDRFIKAAEIFDARSIIRVTGDNPLTSIYWMDRMIEYVKKNQLDYCNTANLPVGCGCEWVSLEALKRAEKEINCQKYNEHVTLWIREGHGNYKKNSVFGPGGGDISVTVDTHQDFCDVKSLITALMKKPEKIDVEDIINYKKHQRDQKG